VALAFCFANRNHYLLLSRVLGEPVAVEVELIPTIVTYTYELTTTRVLPTHSQHPIIKVSELSHPWLLADTYTCNACDGYR